MFFILTVLHCVLFFLSLRWRTIPIDIHALLFLCGYAKQACQQNTVGNFSWPHFYRWFATSFNDCLWWGAELAYSNSSWWFSSGYQAFLSTDGAKSWLSSMCHLLHPQLTFSLISTAISPWLSEEPCITNTAALSIFYSSKRHWTVYPYK